MNANKIVRGLVFLSVTFVVGCASLPNVETTYYLSKTVVGVKVSRTVTCDASKNLFISNAVVPTATQSADPRLNRSVDLSKLNGVFSDADVKIDLYDDGRLKGINSSQTGQGEAVIKSVITLAVSAAAMGFDESGGDKNGCEAIITAAGGAGKPITITYQNDSVDLDQAQGDIGIAINPVDDASKHYAELLKSKLGSICLRAEKLPLREPPNYVEKTNDVLLKLRQPADVKLIVYAGAKGCVDSKSIYQGNVSVAQYGKFYSLPIPTPELFGKKTLAAQFNDAGTITSLQYAETSGAASAINSANSAITAPDQVKAAKIADIKSDADLLAQQQRVVVCLATPAQCK